MATSWLRSIGCQHLHLAIILYHIIREKSCHLTIVILRSLWFNILGKKLVSIIREILKFVSEMASLVYFEDTHQNWGQLLCSQLPTHSKFEIVAACTQRQIEISFVPNSFSVLVFSFFAFPSSYCSLFTLVYFSLKKHNKIVFFLC